MELKYTKNGIDYQVGDVVTGNFEFKEDEGIVCFGEFDAYWPTGSHDYADAIGIYVKTSLHEYSITQINNLSKL